MLSTQVKNVVKVGLEGLGLLDTARSVYHRLRYQFNPPAFVEGKVGLPKHVNMATTFICLAACPHCLFIQEDQHVFRGKKQMDADMGDAVFQAEWARELRGVTFGGGESLLHPKLFDWMETARAKGMVDRQVVTNGVPLQQDEIVERLLATPAVFTNLQVSLDADNAEDYMAAKGIKKVDFEKILDSVRRIAAAHKNNPDVTIVTSFVIGAHNMAAADRLVRLAESLGVDACHLTTLHLVKEEGNPYKNDTLRDLPVEYQALMERTDFNLELTLAPPIRAPYLGFYCDSLADHVSIDPQGRMAVCCHIAWDEKVGLFPGTTGNPMENGVSLEMRRQFIEAAKKDDASLLPEPCRLCSRRLIGKFHFDPKNRSWAFVLR